MGSNLLLAMPIFVDGDSYQLDSVLDDIRQRWGFEISAPGSDDEAAIIEIAGQTVALAFMSVPIPWPDIEGTAKYAYNWINAIDDLADHTGHAIVSVMAGEGSPKERFLLLSKVLYSVLAASDAIGVYQGEQSLLISRRQYLNVMDNLEPDDVPLSLWIYIGLKEYKSAKCAYTYGLTAFDKKEIEIINSKLDLENLYNLLFSFSSYIINRDVTLKDGETIGFTAEQKIGIRWSKGEFVKGESIKLLT
jgi:hypothetical protein